MSEPIEMGSELDKHLVECIRDAHEYHEVRAMIAEWLKRYDIRIAWHAKLYIDNLPVEMPPVQYGSYLLALQAALEYVSEKRKRERPTQEEFEAELERLRMVVPDLTKRDASQFFINANFPLEREDDDAT